jgi:hypothetical protein
MYDPDDFETMINDLVTYKHHFWCHHCGRGLFFPSTCTSHADTVALAGDDVANLDDVNLVDLFQD